jgi:hypothetical protein
MDPNEVTKLDPHFYDRADAHIFLSNDQLADINPGKVSASMMYATARFNAYVSWIGFNDPADMAKARDETIRYFVEQYQKMLEENLDDYINNFEHYRATWPERPDETIN